MKGENIRFRIKSKVGLKGTAKHSSGTRSRHTNNLLQSPYQSVAINKIESYTVVK